jgi:hypothetical protein
MRRRFLFISNSRICLMTRSCVERAVVRATGESLAIVQRLGFSVIEPQVNLSDDPPAKPGIVDWDALELQRVGLFPPRP